MCYEQRPKLFWLSCRLHGYSLPVTTVAATTVTNPIAASDAADVFQVIESADVVSQTVCVIWRRRF